MNLAAKLSGAVISAASCGRGACSGQANLRPSKMIGLDCNSRVTDQINLDASVVFESLNASGFEVTDRTRTTT